MNRFDEIADETVTALLTAIHDRDTRIANEPEHDTANLEFFQRIEAALEWVRFYIQSRIGG